MTGPSPPPNAALRKPNRVSDADTQAAHQARGCPSPPPAAAIRKPNRVSDGDTPTAHQARGCPSPPPAARSAHPGLRPLDAFSAPPSWLRGASKRRLPGTGSPSRRRGTQHAVARLSAAICVTLCLSGGRAIAAEPAVIPADVVAFQRDVAPAVLAARPCDAKHWRQIEPAVHHLALQHADRLAELPDGERVATLARLADFIDRVRKRTAAVPVLAPGRTVIGLLDPAAGLGPKEITTIATSYGGATTTFKKEKEGETLDSVATAFLVAVRDGVAGTAPVTIIVLGHGLPTEIQSYHIRFERLADALLDGTTARAGQGGPADLGDVVLVCDDCFSADFSINLLGCIEARGRDRGLTLGSLPVCIAGTNRDRYGIADVGEKFVPHFWKDVIELYYVRRPRPEAIVLRNFFENVDNMMYGYGRAPIMAGTTIAGWRLIDPALVQDPVVFVPLDDAEVAELRGILGLDADAPLPRWLDIG